MPKKLVSKKTTKTSRKAASKPLAQTVVQKTQTVASNNYSDKNIIVALALCFFLGVIGVHRFYAGKIGTGILMIITVGGFGIWTLIDFILIAVGEFSDKDGKKLKWNALDTKTM